jgi:hypothetical protein
MAMKKKGYKAGGKMPDLSGDGEVTQEDVLIGRGVLDKNVKTKTPAKKMKGGNMVKKGYAKGGKVRGAGIARKGTRPCKMR